MLNTAKTNVAFLETQATTESCLPFWAVGCHNKSTETS